MTVLFEWTGLIIWALICIALAAFLLLAMWVHVSISFVVWRTSIRAGTVRKYWMKKRLWRVRLLIHFLLQPKKTFDLWGSEISSDKCFMDFRGFIPRGKVRGTRS